MINVWKKISFTAAVILLFAVCSRAQDTPIQSQQQPGEQHTQLMSAAQELTDNLATKITLTDEQKQQIQDAIFQYQSSVVGITGDSHTGAQQDATGTTGDQETGIDQNTGVGTEQGTSGTEQGTTGTEQGTSGTEQGTTGTEQGTTGTEQGTTGTEQGTTGTEQGTTGTEQGTTGTEQGTTGTEQGTTGTEQGTTGTEQGTAGTEQGTTGTEQGSSGNTGKQSPALSENMPQGDMDQWLNSRIESILQDNQKAQWEVAKADFWNQLRDNISSFQQNSNKMY